MVRSVLSTAYNSEFTHHRARRRLQMTSEYLCDYSDEIGRLITFTVYDNFRNT